LDGPAACAQARLQDNRLANKALANGWRMVIPLKKSALKQR
jgi:hypothetical protein